MKFLTDSFETPIKNGDWVDVFGEGFTTLAQIVDDDLSFKYCKLHTEFNLKMKDVYFSDKRNKDPKVHIKKINIVKI